MVKTDCSTLIHGISLEKCEPNIIQSKKSIKKLETSKSILEFSLNEFTLDLFDENRLKKP